MQYFHFHPYFSLHGTRARKAHLNSDSNSNINSALVVEYDTAGLAVENIDNMND